MPEPKQPPESGADRLEREQAEAAVERHKAGRKLSVREMRAIRLEETKREERDRWHYYETVPKKHYREMSGRQGRTINEQARRHDIPILGRTVSFPALARWLHDFLAEKAHVLKENGDDAGMQGDSRGAERYREAKAKQEEIKLGIMQGAYSQNDRVLAGLGIYLGSLRETIHGIQKKYGSGVAQEFKRALDNAEARTREFLLAEMSKAGPLPEGLAPKPKKARAKRKPRAKTKPKPRKRGAKK